MSTRATILIKEKRQNNIWLYHHCDGYPERVGSDLKRYLDSLTYWNGEDIANDLIKDKANLNDEGYEVTTCQHGDEAYAYLIDCDNKELKCYDIGLDQYNWGDEDIVEIPY